MSTRIAIRRAGLGPQYAANSAIPAHDIMRACQKNTLLKRQEISVFCRPRTWRHRPLHSRVGVRTGAFHLVRRHSRLCATRRGHLYSKRCVFPDLIAQRSNRQTEHAGRSGAAAAMPRKRMDDEIALDFGNSVPDEPRDGSLVFSFADRSYGKHFTHPSEHRYSRNRDNHAAAFAARSRQQSRTSDVQMLISVVIRRAGLGR